MGLYRKKNIVIGAIGRLIVPEALWTRQMLLAWFGSLLTVLAFDLLWCLQTSFHPLTFFSTYVNAMLLATVMSFPTVIWRRAWPQLVLMLIVDLFMIANLMYCVNYFNAIPSGSYAGAMGIFNTPGIISSSFRWGYIVLPVIAIVTFMLMNPVQTERKPNAVFYLLTFALLLLVSSVTAMFAGGMSGHIRHMKGQNFYASAPPVVYTPVGSLIADATSPDNTISAAQHESVAAWGKNQIVYQGRMTHPADTAARRDNLVLILCESLESWPIGAVVEGKEITPSLNSLMRDSTLRTWYAPRVLSQAGRGQSADGQLLMLAGMYPMHDEVFAMRYADNNYFTIPKAMKMAGAKTYILSGSKPMAWNQGLLARSFGIDNLELSPSWDNAERIGESGTLSDKSLLSQSEAKMRRGDVWPEGEKGYVQIVTSTSETPFKIPEEHKTITLKGNYPGMLRDYLTAVHYTDNALGAFIDYLRSRSDWDRTMVVVAGNHEAFGSRRHSLRQDPYAARLVNAQEYLPLLVINAPFRGRHGAVMGQVDVYTTLLDQLGLPYTWRGMGFSALSPESPAFAVGFEGDVVGDIRHTSPQLMKHIGNAPDASGLLIKYDMMGD